MIESKLFATQNALWQMEVFGWTVMGVVIAITVLALVLDHFEKRK